MSKDWRAYAEHILDAIGKIQRIEERGDLRQDEILYDAALRNLQTLSEATQHLPDELTTQHPAIPWRQISGFRNILVHNYLGNIDADTVHNVIATYLPPPRGYRSSDARCAIDKSSRKDKSPDLLIGAFHFKPWRSLRKSGIRTSSRHSGSPRQ